MRSVATFTPPAPLCVEDVKRELGGVGGGSVDFAVTGEGVAEVSLGCLSLIPVVRSIRCFVL